MPNIKKYSRQAVLFLAFFNSVGIAGLNIPLTSEIFIRLIPLNLLISSFFLLIFHERKKDRIGLAALLIFLTGYFIEVIGVNYGFVFGSYTYGEALGPKILHTPLMIGVNWLMLTYMIWCALGRFIKHNITKILVGSLVMVIYDLLLEPFAIHFGMWGWDGTHVPLQNYIAWFLISLFIFSLLALLKIKIENKIAPGLLLIQLLFFAIVDIIISV